MSDLMDEINSFGKAWEKHKILLNEVIANNNKQISHMNEKMVSQSLSESARNIIAEHVKKQPTGW